MRRPPTRGPQDPWTPRKIALQGYLCDLLPRRPTVDGPAHDALLHIPYAGGSAENPAPSPAPSAAKIALAGFLLQVRCRDSPLHLFIPAALWYTR